VDGLSNLNGGGDAYATPDGTFVFGDSASPSTTYAFSMTNQLASSRAFDEPSTTPHRRVLIRDDVLRRDRFADRAG